MAYQNKLVEVDGLKTRCIETGSDPAVICLHDTSLFERAGLPMKKSAQLDLSIVDNCKHRVRWDAMDRFHEPAPAFLPR